MSHLALFLLGRPRIECDGVSVEINRRKAIALLAYLAVAGESHRRDVLATLLWPAHDQAGARAALGTTLWALNSALGKGWIDADRETVSLNRNAGFWLDVHHFRRLLAECRTHSHTPETMCGACLAALNKAIQLYRGDFLAGFTLRDSTNFDDWQLFQTESLRCELVNALEKLVCCHSTQGEFDKAIGFARRWLALDPLHELAHQHLIRLYAWSGQRAAALSQYRECVRILEADLGASPQKETVRLWQDIKENRLPPPPTASEPWPLSVCTHKLPPQPTPFLGREKEMADIARLLKSPSCRLLTLVGPGGIGKTRLVLQAAAENAHLFPHGAYFVPLAALSAADLIVPAIADSLQFSFRSGLDAKVQLLSYLRDKDMLLVLDNFEHLLEGAALLTEILQNAPGIKLLVTSRERSNLQWEWLLEIEGLRFPFDDTTEAIEDYSAIQLFLQSAARVRQGFSLSEEEKPFIIRTCRFLQGMPLGIELAAAWTQVLSCREIAHEIEDNLGFLTTPLRDVPERHRSLCAVFDYSWGFLAQEERAAFKRLSVFRGGFRREAAERVASTSLPVLSALVRKSFLRTNPNGRYEMLEVLRQYADEKLQEAPEEREKTRALHCTFYADLLHRQAKHLVGEGEKEALEEIAEEIENVRASWQWAVTHGKWREINLALFSFCTFYDVRSWLPEVEEALDNAAQSLRDTHGGVVEPEKGMVLGQILARQGRFCQKLARFDKANAVLHQSLTIFRQLGAHFETAFPLKELGNVAYRLGERAEAKQLYQQSLAIYTEMGSQLGMANCLSNLGIVALGLKEYIEARRLFQEGLSLCYQMGNQRCIAICLSNLGFVAEGLGEYSEAKRLQQECLAISKELGARWAIANSLSNLGFAMCGLGEYQSSKKCFQEAMEAAIEAEAVDIALEALVGMATLLRKEGQKDQASELIDYVLHYPVVLKEIQTRAEQLLTELEPQLAVHVLHHPAVYDEIKAKAEEIKAGSGQFLFETQSQPSLQMVAVAREPEPIGRFGCLPCVIAQNN